MFKSRAAVLLAIVLPWLVVFAPVLWKGECHTQRDAGYYYYPMLEHNARQWQEGRVPLWNPLENIGTPVVEDATAAVFYPGQLILAAPISDFATRYTLYVSLHVLLAAFGAFCLCRAMQCGRTASTLAGVSYALGGSVLYQHCNVIFLVGAAWLPFSLAAGYVALVRRNMLATVGCAVCLALMVLGGEPQSAYHAGLALGLLAIVRWRMQAGTERKAQAASVSEGTCESESSGYSSLLKPFLTLGLIGGIAFALAAIQILPSAQWSSRSQRKTFVLPRNVYEVPQYLARNDNAGWRGVNAGLTGIPVPGTHHDHAYQFSNPPWSLAELFFPNVSGRMDSINRRWTHRLPGADRMWTPSLYMGLLPVLLAISCFSLRSGNVAIRWASWVFVLFAIASLGWYGIGWLVHQIAWSVFGVPPQQIPIGAGTGGLYWLMVKLLPGYVYFRYPAKLFVVASLVISVLAACGFDRLLAGQSRRLRIACTTLTVLTISGLLFTMTCAPTVRGYLDQSPADHFFGPLDSGMATADIFFAFVHALIVLGILFAITVWLKKKPRILRPSLAAGLVFLTIVDLLIANCSMVMSGSGSLWTNNNLTAAKIHQQAITTPAAIPPRVFRGRIWLPADWLEHSSEHRIDESVEFNRETLLPKHQLQENIGVVESFNSIAPYDYWAFMTVARTGGFVRADGTLEPNQEMLALLSTEFLILPKANSAATTLPSPALPRQESQGSQSTASFVVVPTSAPLPRCWLVPEIKQIPALHSNDPDAVGRQTRAALITNGNLRDFRRVAVIECDEDLEFVSGPELSAQCVCEIVQYESNRIEIHARSDQPTVLVLNDYHYPGWTATLKSSDGALKQTLKIHRTNRIMRGVLLPAGDHQVVFEYQPKALRSGMWISGINWLLIGVFVCAVACGRLSRCVTLVVFDERR